MPEFMRCGRFSRPYLLAYPHQSDSATNPGTSVMSDTMRPPFESPVMPVQYQGNHTFNFRCYKGIGCFNACCKSIDITLTPYDILRLKKRLGITSAEFLRRYTFPYEMEKDGLAGVKLLPVEGTTQCQFMTDEGCSVYEDRPTACRYYPVALLSMRKQDEYIDTNSYAIVQEAHCLGHNEERSLTIDEYRSEQGVDEYDELARGWRQLILKKKSLGPAIGKPSKRSLQLFFLVCYNLDDFRAMTMSEGFREGYELSAEEWTRLETDDVELMQFGFRLLKQVLFGEVTIPVRADVAERRQAKLRAQWAAEEAVAAERRKQQEDVYDAIFDEDCKPSAGGCGGND